MKTLNCVILIVIAWLFNACSTLPQDHVKVEQGIVQGSIEDGLKVFKGIPFAAPPIGDLRWKAPQPVESWEGVKQTIEYAPAPMQGGNPVSGKSEDCLYLNVWTPAQAEDEKLPVLVWIYGGGFSFGSTSDPVHNGEHLARKGVVLVSVAYRVGQLGFLAHPELSAENPQGVSGNYGILDMIAGLEWIQKNISAFGGDPDKVTIFGESAGGIAVSMLCASPLAKGLFHGAISQSGGSFGPTRPTTYPGENMKSLQVAEEDGLEYAQRAGASSLENLRKIEGDQLPLGMGMGGSWPIVDGYVIPDDQYKLYEAGNFNDVPVLIGYNSDEGLSFPAGRSPEDYISSVNLRFGPFADSLLAAYPAGENSVNRQARNLMRDAAFGWHTWSWAKLQSAKGNSEVYFYYFDQHPDYPEDSEQFDHGTPHGVDVPFVFMNLDASSSTKSDLEMSELMGDYWTNFAKYANPNGQDLPEWTPFSASNSQVLNLGKEIYLRPVPDESSLTVLDTYFKWRRSDEGKSWANNQMPISE
jgi:para-nitrobenzyl esterase